MLRKVVDNAAALPLITSTQVCFDADNSRQPASLLVFCCSVSGRFACTAMKTKFCFFAIFTDSLLPQLDTCTPLICLPKSTFPLAQQDGPSSKNLLSFVHKSLPIIIDFISISSYKLLKHIIHHKTFRTRSSTGDSQSRPLHHPQPSHQTERLHHRNVQRGGRSASPGSYRRQCPPGSDDRRRRVLQRRQ